MCDASKYRCYFAESNRSAARNHRRQSVLAELSRQLFDAGVLPYYLHVLDRVRGAAHFDVQEARARTLAGALAAELPGYLVPRLVREVHGAPAKIPLSPVFPS